jgi:hypothetical protein
VGVDDDLELSAIPADRAVGVRTFGRAFGRVFLRVRGDCQNTTSRPRALVNTIWERLSRLRSRTTSMARRTHDRSRVRSTMSGSAGHSSAETG